MHRTHPALDHTLFLFLFLFLVLTGLVKIFLPIETLASMWVWPGQYPWLARSTAWIDLAGGLGVLLPPLTRIRPRVTVLAAVGCISLQLCAITFHLSRGEAYVTPINFLVLALSIAVA
jgi:hypothetical protein